MYWVGARVGGHSPIMFTLSDLRRKWLALGDVRGSGARQNYTQKEVHIEPFKADVTVGFSFAPELYIIEKKIISPTFLNTG